MGTKQLIVFTIDAQEFGIDIDLVSSIENMLEIFKIPNTSHYIEGLVNLRGKVHTVFNLRKRFSMPCPEFNESNKIIMVNTSDSIVGIIVDDVKEIIKVENSDFVTAPKALSNMMEKFLSGIAKSNGRAIMLLDIGKVFAADEAEQIIK